MERGQAAWDFLKRRLKELGLSEQGGILRTKANCLRICEGARSLSCIRKVHGTRDAIRRFSNGSSASTSWQDVS